MVIYRSNQEIANCIHIYYEVLGKLGFKALLDLKYYFSEEIPFEKKLQIVLFLYSPSLSFTPSTLCTLKHAIIRFTLFS